MFSFYAKRIKKQCYLKVPKENKPFQRKRTSAQKTTTICIFSKGLVHGFCQKNGDFLILSFYAKWIKKQSFFLRFRKKRSLFRGKEHWLKKPTKFAFFQRGQSMLFVKKLKFFNVWFLCKKGQEKLFFDGSERKEGFLDQKNIS